MTPATYRIERLDYDGFPMVDFICRNTQTLSLIRPQTFLYDFMGLTQNEAELSSIANRYAKKVTNRLLELGY